MIKDELARLNDQINTLCARLDRPLPKVVLISKFIDDARILEAYDAGHRIFGESRMQEFMQKTARLPHDIEWHFVGHLQTNKVKSVVGNAALIHSVDSMRLAEAIDREAARLGIVQQCLLQVNTSGEDTKFGMQAQELPAIHKALSEMQHIHIKGLMTIGAFVDEDDRIRTNFRQLRTLRDTMLAHDNAPQCIELSMGMSGDWQIAIEEGATYLRIGSLVFGERG